MGYALGIDLGTTFTAVAMSGESGTTMVPLARGGEVAEPSVVYAAPGGSLLTGDAAEDAGTDAPQRLARGFKRRLGDPTPLVVGGTPVSPTALLAAQLRSIVSRVESAEGARPESIVLTCPAVWGSYRREHFDGVPRLAGLTEAVIVTEPEAAATHYAAERRLGVGELVAVYDLGGGTFDTTILRAQPAGMEIVGTPEGIERLGGMDFDDALFAHVDDVTGGTLGALDPADPAEAAVLAAVRRDCVRGKEELSTEPEVTLRLPLPTGECEIVVTRPAFNEMIRPALELTAEALRRALASAGLVPDDLAAVLLAGGSSRIPLVSEMVSEAFGRPVRVSLHPKLTVALGAAAIAAKRLPKPAPEPAAAVPAPRASTASARAWWARWGLVPAAIVTAVVVAAAVAVVTVTRDPADLGPTESQSRVSASPSQAADLRSVMVWSAKDLGVQDSSPTVSTALARPFALYNVTTKKCADIPGYENGILDGPVNQYTCDWSSHDNQLVYLDANADSSFVIRNAKDGLCLDVPGVSYVGPGTLVSETVCFPSAGDNQRFRLWDRTGRGDYWVVNEKSGLCLDVAGPGTGGNDARLTLSPCSDTDDHWWRLTN